MQYRKLILSLVLPAVSLFSQSKPDTLRTLDTQQQSDALAAIRGYALNFSRQLPNFTCTQIIHRDFTPQRFASRPAALGPRPQRDLIEEELSIVEHHETHRLLRMNGVAPTDPTASTPGLTSWGEFGHLLEAIFLPAVQAEFRWDKIVTRDGHRMLKFDFHVPQTAGYALVQSDQTFRVPFKGVIYADPDSKAVTRVEMDVVDIPSRSEYRSLHFTLDYQPTEVAGSDYMLPAHSRMRIGKVEGETSSEIDYKNYRRFATESTLQFDEEPENQ